MGNDVQADLLRINSRVEIPHSNSQVFRLNNLMNRHYITEPVEEWLNIYGDDWGLENWYVLEVLHTEQEQVPGFKLIGRKFVFGTAQQAILFKLTWA